jgi:dihydroorotate dehydrogenase electron transfer subunit
MILGAQTAAMIYPRDLLPPEIELLIATEDGTAGRKGLATDFLPELARGADQIFACGPTDMYHSMASQQILKQKPVQISLESRMGCGLGACFGCTLKTKQGLKQICREGPTFELGEILWEEIST